MSHNLLIGMMINIAHNMNSQQVNKGGQCDTAPLIRLEAENAAIMSIITKINRLDHNESIMNDLICINKPAKQ